VLLAATLVPMSAPACTSSSLADPVEVTKRSIAPRGGG
jgi:hypothetical protein